MTPYCTPTKSRIHEGPATLTAQGAASISGAVQGIQSITGILLTHEVGAQCEGDDVLRLSNPSVCGLLHSVGALAELIELRLADGMAQAQKVQEQGGMA